MQLANTTPDNFVFSVFIPEIFSENEYLKPGAAKRGNRIMTWLYKPDSIKKYQAALEDKIKTAIENDLTYKKYINCKNVFLVVYNAFCLKSNFSKRDTTNMVKLYEDSLKKVLGVDDSNSITVLSSKLQLDESVSDEEIITAINFYDK